MEWWTVWGGFCWTAINLPHTCCVSRRLQWGSTKYDVTYLNNSQDRHRGVHKYSAPGAWATELGTVAPNICGFWVRNLVHVNPGAWNFKLVATFTENLCTPVVASCQNNCWPGSFEGLNGGHKLYVLEMHFWATDFLTRNFCVLQETRPQGHMLDEI